MSVRTRIPIYSPRFVVSYSDPCLSRNESEKRPVSEGIPADGETISARVFSDIDGVALFVPCTLSGAELQTFRGSEPAATQLQATVLGSHALIWHDIE